VILLRDVEGWAPEEISDALGLSPGNQRVLLHRARSTVRGRLEDYMEAVA
jgi:RNA polymerase sigma-70 factor (ECF subfamily)